MYDILCLNSRGNRNVLIEVKSSIDMPLIRMAIGQLFDYRRYLPIEQVKRGRADILDLAVLLPEEPTPDAKSLLSSLGIKVIWFKDVNLTKLSQPLY
jgi:hypothetical protein